MSAPKIKNLVILILVLLNVFLLALVIPIRLTDRRHNQQADAALVRLFAEADVSLRAAEIPKTKTLYPADIPMSQEGVLPAVRAILGQEILTRQEENITHFSSSLGAAQLHADGTLEAAVTDGQRRDPAAYTQELLAKMGLGWGDLHTVSTGNRSVFSVQLYAAEAPIVSHCLRFYYENSCLVRVEGLMLPPQAAVVTTATQCIGARDALVAFLASRISTGWVGGTIESVRQGYALSADAVQSLWHLQPVWYISTDGGNFLVDGLTKVVTPA